MISVLPVPCTLHGRICYDVDKGLRLAGPCSVASDASNGERLQAFIAKAFREELGRSL